MCLRTQAQAMAVEGPRKVRLRRSLAGKRVTLSLPGDLSANPPTLEGKVWVFTLTESIR